MVAINGSFTNSIGHIKKTQQNKAQNISFSGQELTKNEKGDHVYKFYLPPINFNPKKDKIELEVIVFDSEAPREYKKLGDKAVIQVGNNAAKKLSREILNYLENTGSSTESSILEHEENTNCYKFNLTKAKEHIPELKNDKEGKYTLGFRIKVNGEPVIDNSQRLATADGEIFNIALDPKRALLNEVRTIYHLMPDKLHPKQTQIEKGPNKGKDVQSDHYTYNGGDLYGVIDKLDYIKDLGATRILSTPVTNAGGSHYYWTNNALQVSERLGGNKAYNELQTELFKRGMGMIADGAYVNEGWQGVHLADVYNQQGNPKDSPFYYWFDIKGFPLQAGVLPSNTDSQSSHVNMDDFVQQRSKLIDGKTKAAKNSPELLAVYDKNIVKTDENGQPVIDKKGSETWVEYDPDKVDHSKINKYTHSAQPTVIQLNPGCEKNIEFTPTNEEGQINSWDGSGIPKKRFMIPENILKMMARVNPEEAEKAVVGSIQVRDDLVQIGRFWTDKVDKLLVEHTVQALSSTLKNAKGSTATDKIYNALSELAKEKNGVAQIPSEKMKKFLNDKDSIATINNILSGDYNLPDVAPKSVFDGLTSFPLDSIELPAEITRILSSPYIKCYAMEEGEIGKSRSEIKQSPDYNNRLKQMNRLYSGMGSNYAQMDEFYTRASEKVKTILKNVEPKLIQNGELSEEGKQIFRLISDDVMKYITVEALAGVTPDEKSIKEGKVSYENQDLEAKTYENLSSLHSYRNSHRNLAEYVTDKLKSGVNNVDEDKLSRFIESRVNKLNTNKDDISPATLAKVAKFVVDKTESGLEWRIDAAKDVADLDQVRAGNCSFDEAWRSVIETLKPMREAILKINPHSYSIFETTDVQDLMNFSKDPKVGNFPESSYQDQCSAESSFIHGTKSTTETNYNFLYSTLQSLVHATFEKGGHEHTSSYAFSTMAEKLIKGWGLTGGHLTSMPLDGVNFSHLMVDNHDKPRILHMFAVDIADFFGLDSGKNNNPNKLNEILSYGNNLWAEELKLKKLQEEYEKQNPGEPVPVPPQYLPIISELKQLERYEEDLKKAIFPARAMANAVNDSLGKAYAQVDIPKKDKEIIKAVITELSGGTEDQLKETSYYLANGEEYKENRTAELFARKPFHVNWQDIKDLAQSDKYKASLTPDQWKELEKATHEHFLKPAIEKFKAILPLMVALPGAPTLFEGTELGETGVETPSKNEYQQNRQRNHFEYLDEKIKDKVTGKDTNKDNPEYRKFIAEFKDDVKSLMNLRKQPGLSCLTNGSTIMLDEQSKTPEFDRKSEENDKNYNKSQFAFYRYNNESEVIAFFDYSGFGATREEYPNPEIKKKVNYIDVSKIAEELKRGLEPKSVFVDALDPESKVRYVLSKNNPNHIVREDGQNIELHNGSAIILKKVKDANKLSFGSSQLIKTRPVYSKFETPSIKEKQGILNLKSSKLTQKSLNISV